MADQWTRQAGVYMIYESSEIDDTALTGWQGRFMVDTNFNFRHFTVVIGIIVFRQPYNHIFCCMQHMRAVKANK